MICVYESEYEPIFKFLWLCFDKARKTSPNSKMVLIGKNNCLPIGKNSTAEYEIVDGFSVR